MVRSRPPNICGASQQNKKELERCFKMLQTTKGIKSRVSDWARVIIKILIVLTLFFLLGKLCIFKTVLNLRASRYSHCARQPVSSRFTAQNFDTFLMWLSWPTMPFELTGYIILPWRCHASIIGTTYSCQTVTASVSLCACKRNFVLFIYRVRHHDAALITVVTSLSYPPELPL